MQIQIWTKKEYPVSTSKRGLGNMQIFFYS